LTERREGRRRGSRVAGITDAGKSRRGKEQTRGSRRGKYQMRESQTRESRCEDTSNAGLRSALGNEQRGGKVIPLLCPTKGYSAPIQKEGTGPRSCQRRRTWTRKSQTRESRCEDTTNAGFEARVQIRARGKCRRGRGVRVALARGDHRRGY